MLSTSALLLALTLGPNPVYRSVGNHAGPLATGGANLLVIAGTTATFAAPLPEIVGVGDALQYDSNGDGTVDAVCFLHKRISPLTFTVQTASPGTPAPTEGTQVWALFRAYRTLAEAANVAVRPGLALGGSENPDIAPAVRNFDPWTGGARLTSTGQRYYFACYDDGVDDSLVWVGPPWDTDREHRVEIFTPHLPTQVGVSQRHDGTWGTGYRRTHAVHVQDMDVRLDGLAIRQDRPLVAADGGTDDNRVFMVHTGHRGSEIMLSNCLGWAADVTSATAARAFDVVEDLALDAGTTQVRAWNDIGIGDAPGANAVFAGASSDDVAFHSCTAVATSGAAAFLSDGTVAGAVAPALVGCLGTSDGGAAVVVAAGAPLFPIAFSAVSDDTVSDATSTSADAGNATLRAFTFRGPGDYHLDELDTGARGLGAATDGGAGFSFTTDIDGQPRAEPWDIGADQWVPEAAPQVTTGTPTIELDGSATLRGTVVAHHLETHGWFRVGAGALAACDDSAGTQVPETTRLAVGRQDTGVTMTFATAVLADGPYWVCAFAENRAGKVWGQPVAFDIARPPVTPVLTQRLMVVGCDCGTPGDPLALAWALLAVLAWRRSRR